MQPEQDAGAPTITLPPPAPELGFTTGIYVAFGIGLGLLLMAGLLRSFSATASGPTEGIMDTSIWFAWLGTSVVALAMVAAGFAARAAAPGVRVALLAVGAFLFVQGSQAIPFFT